MTSALDLILGGKVLIPSYPPGAAATGNPNLVGGDATFGSGGALIGAQGNVFVFAAAGTAGLQAAGTGAEYVVATFTLPSNTFDVSGRGITIQVSGSFGANADAGKLSRIIFNPTGASTVGGTVGLGAGGIAVATTSVGVYNGSAFSLTGNVFKYGTSGSNTQVCIHAAAQVGAAVQTLSVPQAATATESGSIVVAITAQSGSSGVAGIATDVVINYVEITACN